MEVLGARARLRGVERLGTIGEHRLDALQDLRRDVVAAALRAQELLQALLERRMVQARVAPRQMLVDLDAQGRLELAIEVELDLLQHVLAINR